MLCFPNHRSREEEELKKWLKAVVVGNRTGGVILETDSSVQSMSSWQQSSCKGKGKLWGMDLEKKNKKSFTFELHRINWM